MGLPTYQIQMYQRVLPIMKYVEITQKSPNLFKQLENIKTLQKKSKSKRTVKRFEQSLQFWKMVLTIYHFQMYQNTPPISKYTNITKKSPNLSEQLENIKSLQKKSAKSKQVLKTLEHTLQYWEIGLTTNQIQTYEKASPIVIQTNITQTLPNSSTQLKSIKNLFKRSKRWS